MATPTVTPEDVMRLHSATGLPVLECRDWLADMDADDRVAVLEAAVAAKAARERGESRLLRDPIEFDPRVIPLIKEAEGEAKRELAGSAIRGRMGFCHLFWRVKKRILRHRFGIKWRSPADMNPGVKFD